MRQLKKSINYSHKAQAVFLPDLIMPKSEGIYLAILAFFLFIVATNTQIGWLFFIDSLILSFILIALFLPAFNLRKVKLKRTFPFSCFEDEKIKIEIEVSNLSKFSKYFLLFKEKIPFVHPKEAEVNLWIQKILAKSKIELNYEVKCFKRGFYQFPPSEIQSEFPFGLFKYKKKFKKEFEKILIYPVSPNLLFFPLSRDFGFTYHHKKPQKIKGESFDFFAIREYQYGDNIKLIHWPSSARWGKLYLKEYLKPRGGELFLVLEANQDCEKGVGKETSFEYAVKITLSILSYGKKLGYSLNLLSYGINEKNALFNPRWGKILEALAKIKPSGIKNLREFLNENMNFFHPSSYFFIIMETPISIKEEILKLGEKNISVWVILIHSYTFIPSLPDLESKIQREKFLKVKKELEDEKIPVYDFSKNQDISTLFLKEVI